MTKHNPKAEKMMASAKKHMAMSKEMMHKAKEMEKHMGTKAKKGK